jgi:hypothetical protein
MKNLGAAAFFFFLLPLHAAHADCLSTNGISTICSNTWSFRARCDGEDVWNKWTVDGSPKPSDSFIRPWLDHPIVVVGFELIKLRRYPSWYARLYQKWFTSDDANEWFGVGSTIEPHAMIWLGPGETHTTRMWSKGYGLPWPSTSQARPVVHPDVAHMSSASGDLIDLHGYCNGGGHVTILLTLYYVADVSHP